MCSRLAGSRVKCEKRCRCWELNWQSEKALRRPGSPTRSYRQKKLKESRVEMGPSRASPGTQYLFGVSKYLLAEFTVQRSYR
jgi:hypothetical protein